MSEICLRDSRIQRCRDPVSDISAGKVAPERGPDEKSNHDWMNSVAREQLDVKFRLSKDRGVKLVLSESRMSARLAMFAVDLWNLV